MNVNGITLLLLCSEICTLHFYVKVFDHPNKAYCYCADSVAKAAPLPLPWSLSWRHDLPEENRKADIEPDIFPRFQLEDE